MRAWTNRRIARPSNVFRPNPRGGADAGRWLTPWQATMLIVGLGLTWRTIRYALAFPLWGDEAFVAVNLLTRGPAGLLGPLEYDQVAPPGFLLGEWLTVQLFGGGELSLRLLLWLASLGSLCLFVRFARETSSRRVTLLAAALLAASFYPARHGNEVKPYATDLLVSLLISSLGWRVWRTGRGWAALTVTATLGVWLSYPAVFPAFTVGALLAGRWVYDRPRGGAAAVAVYGAAVATSFGLLVWLVAGPQARGATLTAVTWTEAFPPLAKPWLLPWWLLNAHAGHMMAYPHGGGNFQSSGSLILAVVGVVGMARQRPRRALLWLLLGPLTVTFAAAALHRYPYGMSVRVSIFMAPAFCLLIAEGVLHILRAYRAPSRVPTLLALMLGAVVVIYSILDICMPYTRWDDEEHRRLVAGLAAEAGAGDEWIVFNGATPPPKHIPDLMHSRWIARVAEVRYAVLSLAPVPVRWEPDPATVAGPPGGRVWLIEQDHGSLQHFPRERCAAYEAEMTRRLGPPETRRVFELPERERVTAVAYRVR